MKGIKRKINNIAEKDVFYNKEINFLTKSNVSLQHSNNNKKNNELINCEVVKNDKLLNGWTSEIHQYDSNNKPYIVKKYYNKNINKNILIENFNNEVNSLIIMKGEPHIPKIYGINTLELSITMEHCSEQLNITNCPKNWKKQINEIYDILQKYNIYHNDIHSYNFCVKNKIIYLIDFGLAKHHIDFQYQNFSREVINNSESINELFQVIRNNGIEIRKCMFCEEGMKNI
jgi:tRNA A-37 threonylcarbamoyl transferase component Bud32